MTVLIGQRSPDASRGGGASWHREDRRGQSGQRDLLQRRGLVSRQGWERRASRAAVLTGTLLLLLQHQSEVLAAQRHRRLPPAAGVRRGSGTLQGRPAARPDPDRGPPGIPQRARRSRHPRRSLGV